MPQLDGTGPYGSGPHGRGMGPCRSGSRVAFGMGRGRRMGMGRAFQDRPESSGTVIERDLHTEIEVLEGRLKYLKELLANEGKVSP